MQQEELFKTDFSTQHFFFEHQKKPKGVEIPFYTSFKQRLIKEGGKLSRQYSLEDPVVPLFVRRSTALFAFLKQCLICTMLHRLRSSSESKMIPLISHGVAYPLLRALMMQMLSPSICKFLNPKLIAALTPSLRPLASPTKIWFILHLMDPAATSFPSPSLIQNTALDFP